MNINKFYQHGPLSLDLLAAPCDTVTNCFKLAQEYIYSVAVWSNLDKTSSMFLTTFRSFALKQFGKQ